MSLGVSAVTIVLETGPSRVLDQNTDTEIASGATAKIIGLQPFFEMIDLKHRHGSDLRVDGVHYQTQTSSVGWTN